MKRVFIQTFGCQMNERDSENMMGLLARRDFVQTSAVEDADLILVNTCSIREHATDKAASQLGRLAQIKKLRPVKIGVMGCLAQQDGKLLMQRFPCVDFVLGPDAIPRLAEMVDAPPLRRTLDLSQDLEDPQFLREYLSYSVTRPESQGKSARVRAYVIISKGCDFRCTFCVVPNTRGPERSASPQEIVEEVKTYADLGIREVTLLGQNVNSYGKNFTTPFCFPDLLHLIENSLPRESFLQRLRFTTSHPLDLSEDLMRAFSEIPRLCAHLHLPVQCGSDRVLRRMKRLYTIADYRKRIEGLRRYIPGISLTTDIIVGFPGEEEADFQRTLDFIEEVGYTNLYAFKYSQRPFTPAQHLEDSVSEEDKSERLARVLTLQQRLSREQNQKLAGKVMEVLVEGLNRNGEKPGCTGRTPCSRLVHFAADQEARLLGKLVQVKIEAGLDNSLLGSYVEGSAH